MDEKRIKTGTLYRSAKFDREHIDDEARTVDIAFSSEEPVERWFGKEILDHGSKSVRLGRLNDSGPLLMDHDPRDHVGVVERVSIDSDRIGRAVVRFGKSARAEEVFNDVKDGIRSGISVGYQIHRMKQDESDVDDPVYRATDWEPLEVSFVAVPADVSVGVGRGHDDGDFETIMEVIEMSETDPKPDPKPAPQPSINVDDERNKIRTAELARIQDMNVLGERHNCREMAQEFITEGKTVNDLRRAILDKMPDPEPAGTRSLHDNPDIGLSDKEVKRFSFIRAINALANPGDRRAQEAAAFELECSTAVAEKRGVSAQGIYVPEEETNVFGYDWKAARGKEIHRGMVPPEVLRRDLSAGTATDGAELVATNLLSGSFIDVLRNALVVAQAGATFLRDLNGDVAIPRKTSGSAGGWISTEGGNAAQSDPQFDQVTLTPKTCGSYTEYTRQLRLQSSLDVEALVRNDLAMGLALTIDAAAINGTGASGQPQGVLGTTGIGSVVGGTNGASPTWDNVVQLETDVDASNAAMGGLSYLLNANTVGKFKRTFIDAGSGERIWDSRSGALPVNGYGVHRSNQIPSNLTKGTGTNLSAIMFGNWADLLIGMWGGLDLLIDPYTNSLSGTVRIVAHQSADVAVRHPESFSAMQDAITT